MLITVEYAIWRIKHNGILIATHKFHSNMANCSVNISRIDVCSWYLELSRSYSLGKVVTSFDVRSGKLEPSSI